MNEDNLTTNCIMDRFASGLMAYIDEYYASTRNGIYKPVIDYSIPHDDYISAHSQEIMDELRSLKPVCKYSDELKDVAIQYLPLFTEKYPQYKKADCLMVKQSLRSNR